MMAEDDIFASLEGLFDDVDETEIKSVKDMSNIELLDAIEDAKDQLFQMEQALRPRDQEARDIHSWRNACQVEARKRGLPI